MLRPIRLDLTISQNELFQEMSLHGLKLKMVEKLNKPIQNLLFCGV